MERLDLSTNPLDFQTLVSGKELVAQEVFRIIINAGVLEYLNEQITASKIAYLKSTISSALQEFDKITTIKAIDVVFTNEQLAISIRAQLTDKMTIDIEIDLTNLTVDYR